MTNFDCVWILELGLEFYSLYSGYSEVTSVESVYILVSFNAKGPNYPRMNGT